jgi:hypothetical protein
MNGSLPCNATNATEAGFGRKVDVVAVQDLLEHWLKDYFINEGGWQVELFELVDIRAHPLNIEVS